MADKASLRVSMRMRRKAYVASRGDSISEDWARLAEQAFAHLATYKTIASYVAVGSELCLAPLDQRLNAAGIALALPKVCASVNAPLLFARYALSDLLQANNHTRIPEPGSPARYIVPQVVLVPLLAVDHRGIRLGQGAGHYDRGLHALRACGTVKAVGIAYDCQIIDHIPDDPWDEALDAMVTPSGWVSFKA